MYQGTTPTIPLKFKGVDLTEAKIFLTLQDEKKKRQQTFTSGDDFTVQFDGQDTVGTIRLTQQQTLAMSAGRHIAQARWIFADGSTGITKMQAIMVNDALLKDVISYGE